MGRKEGYANPVAIASFSMDPAIITWLNKYARKHKTTKSWIVRKALHDFREKHDPELPEAPPGFWLCPPCMPTSGPTANADGDTHCWRCKEAKP